MQTCISDTSSFITDYNADPTTAMAAATAALSAAALVEGEAPDTPPDFAEPDAVLCAKLDALLALELPARKTVG